MIKAKEVSRKVANNARLASTVDQEGNVIQRGTLVKIRDRTNILFGKIGEVR